MTAISTPSIVILGILLAGLSQAGEIKGQVAVQGLKSAENIAVYWPSVSGSKKLAHNMGTWPQGVKKSFTFNDLGVAPLLCNVHSEMSGYIYVAPTPYFAITGKDGSFDIKDVPAGHYTLKTWSEEGKPTSAPVDVAAGPATANLTVHR